MPDGRYSVATLAGLIDELLELELSRQSPDPPARALAALGRAEQDRALQLLATAGKAHTEVGYQLALHLPEAFELLDSAGVEHWIDRALELYDTRGLYQALQCLRNVATFAEEAREQAGEARLDDYCGILGHIVIGLSGRPLQLVAGDTPWTDTERLWLPPTVGRFADPDTNRCLYRAMAVQLWAQTRFGTWAVDPVYRIDDDRPPLRLQRALADEADPETLLHRLGRIEAIRLDGCIERSLPGIHRDMQRLLALAGETLAPADWNLPLAALRHPDADLALSLAVAQAQSDAPSPPPVCYLGALHPEPTGDAVRHRLRQSRQELGRALWRLLQAPAVADAENAPESPPGNREIRAVPAADHDGRSGVELTIDGQPVNPPPDVVGRLQSLLQDFGEIPDEYLVAAGPGRYDSAGPGDPGRGASVDEDPEAGAFSYDEWDCRRKGYRKGWCVLRETELPPADLAFHAATLDRYRHLVRQLRRSFEALRGEDRRLKRQPAGDGIDLDAQVEAFADGLLGRETGEQLYTQVQRVERSIAVLFMVDMSGSTKGWINRAEREALVLLCEALERLGDRYAIYGFSGWTRKRCEVFPVKSFDTPYGDAVRRRIAAIDARDYTRMGAAIRHLAGRLAGIDARTRLLVTLSDGKPEDYDHYRGHYAIEDTRMALLEARRDGIHPFCITIDSEGGDYLPRMYGPASYVVVDDVAKLPFKVADIYRRLTT